MCYLTFNYSRMVKSKAFESSLLLFSTCETKFESYPDVCVKWPGN